VFSLQPRNRRQSLSNRNRRPAGAHPPSSSTPACGKIEAKFRQRRRLASFAVCRDLAAQRRSVSTGPSVSSRQHITRVARAVAEVAAIVIKPAHAEYSRTHILGLKPGARKIPAGQRAAQDNRARHAVVQCASEAGPTMVLGRRSDQGEIGLIGDRKDDVARRPPAENTIVVLRRRRRVTHCCRALAAPFFAAELQRPRVPVIDIADPGPTASRSLRRVPGDGAAHLSRRKGHPASQSPHALRTRHLVEHQHLARALPVGGR